MKVLLVDDHALFREALSTLLVHRQPSLEIVGAVSTARDAVKAVESLQPDVVLMDIMLGGQTGIAAIRELRRLAARCRILILTALVEPAFVVEALGAGADGYALKEQGIDEIFGAIRSVMRGGGYLAPRMEKSVGGPLPEHRPSVEGVDGVVESLSVREREVFGLIVAGHTNQRISGELFISVKTVETHRMRINKKLRVHSTVELLRLAALHGLVSA